MKALRVVVVEDEAVIAMLLADLIGAMGHDVCAIAATETARWMPLLGTDQT